MSTQDRKQREFERRGQDILDAALSLFQADDWEHVTVDAIARKSDVAKGTVYKHFASKDEIYARLAMRFQREIALEAAGIDKASLPLLERFRQHIQVAWNRHLSSKALHRVFMYCNRPEFRSRLEPSVLQELEAIAEAEAQSGIAFLTQGIEQGIFPRKPIPEMLFGIQAAVWGGIQLVWSGYLGEIDKAKYLDELTKFLLAGLIHSDKPLPKS